jgi:hypothetical protein
MHAEGIYLINLSRNWSTEREREMQKAYILHGGPIDVAHVGVAKSLSHKKKITGHVPEPNQRERESP